MNFLLLLVVVFCGASEIPLYTIPKTVLRWEPATGDDLKCHLNEKGPDSDSTQSVRGKVIRDGVQEEMVVDGVECIGHELITHTKENFWGNTRSWWSTRPVTPDRLKCKQAIESFDRSFYSAVTAGDYPECSGKWMDTRVCKKTIIRLKNDHTVRFDPFKRRYVSPLFPGGFCSQDECDTIHSSEVWFLKTPHSKTCDIFDDFTTTNYYKNNEWIGTSGQVGIYRSNKGACSMEFCGIKGVLFHDGWWFGHEIDLPVCPDTRTPITHSVAETVAEGEIAVLNLMHLVACQEVKARFKQSKRLFIQDLDYFRPQHKGPGYAFRLNNGTLEKALTRYDGLASFDIILNNNRLLVNEEPYTKIVHSNGIANYFNGIINDKGKIVIPRKELLESDYNAKLYASSGIAWTHPKLVIISNTSRDDSDQGFDDTPGGSGMIIPGFSFEASLAIILVPIIVGTGLLVLIICCCCCGPMTCAKLCRRKDQRGEYDPVPNKEWATVNRA